MFKFNPTRTSMHSYTLTFAICWLCTLSTISVPTSHTLTYSGLKYFLRSPPPGLVLVSICVPPQLSKLVFLMGFLLLHILKVHLTGDTHVPEALLVTLWIRKWQPPPCVSAPDEACSKALHDGICLDDLWGFRTVVRVVLVCEGRRLAVAHTRSIDQALEIAPLESEFLAQPVVLPVGDVSVTLCRIFGLELLELNLKH